jgi:hypothetical protein
MLSARTLIYVTAFTFREGRQAYSWLRASDPAG